MIINSDIQNRLHSTL